MGNAVQLAPCHKDVSPQGPELQRRIPAQLQHPSSGRLVQMPGQRYRIQEAGNTISTRDRRVKPQEGHPWSEKLGATKAEARYMTHKKDMRREESRESQGVRTRGDNGALHIAQPNKELASIAAHVKELPGPSRSRHVQSVSPLRTLPAHPASQDLPSTGHIFHG